VTTYLHTANRCYHHSCRFQADPQASKPHTHLHPYCWQQGRFVTDLFFLIFEVCTKKNAGKEVTVVPSPATLSAICFLSHPDSFTQAERGVKIKVSSSWLLCVLLPSEAKWFLNVSSGSRSKQGCGFVGRETGNTACASVLAQTSASHTAGGRKEYIFIGHTVYLLKGREGIILQQDVISA